MLVAKLFPSNLIWEKGKIKKQNKKEGLLSVTWGRAVPALIGYTSNTGAPP